MLIGNKCDMNDRREVNYEEGLELGTKKNNLKHVNIKFHSMRQVLNHQLTLI